MPPIILLARYLVPPVVSPLPGCTYYLACYQVPPTVSLLLRTYHYNVSLLPISLLARYRVPPITQPVTGAGASYY